MLHASTATNWVDRGESAERKVRQVLAHYLGVPDLVHAPPAWLAQATRDVIGMVAADVPELQLAGHLRTLARAQGRDTPEALRGTRLVAIALWHIVKAAEVRDRAERVLAAVARQVPPGPPLGEWLATRLVSPDERPDEATRDTPDATPHDTPLDTPYAADDVTR